MNHIPQLLAPDSQVQTGESTLLEGLGAPLTFGHAYITLIVCLSGCAHFALNFKERTVRRHEVLVVAEDTLAMLKRRSHDFKVYFCLMPKDFAVEVAYQLPNPLFMFLHDNPHYVPAKQDKRLIRMWLAQTQDVAQHCWNYQRIMLRNQLQNFFLKIAEKISPIQEETRKFSRKEVLCWRFWDLVGQHCTRHREVKFYADSLSITPFYLSQLTKVFFNDTPKGLIDRQVTLEIKALLSYSNMAIGQIADKLYFNDASYLCRYFKRQAGVSLSLYRKQDKETCAG